MAYSILVDSNKQLLQLYQDNNCIAVYPVSTGKNGMGQQRDSFCTPQGQHLIRAKIGASAPPNTVFVGRRPTGELFCPELYQQFPQRDWILTRIMWLSGCEPGFNRLGQVDTMRRYIYIHGTPEQTKLGVPGSKGCIRMANSDIIEFI